MCIWPNKKILDNKLCFHACGTHHCIIAKTFCLFNMRQRTNFVNSAWISGASFSYFCSTFMGCRTSTVAYNTYVVVIQGCIQSVCAVNKVQISLK
eukprot:UN11592